MPTPAKTSNEQIVTAARALLEAQGPDFSLAALANTVGIRAPSLYKRFADRAAILKAVEQATMEELGGTIAAAIGGRAKDPLARAAHAYRKFAHANPRAYALIFNPQDDDDDETQKAREASIAPVLAFFAGRLGPARALSAARTLTAFLHGFVTMELAGAFRLGDDVDAAFDDGLKTITSGLGL